MSSESDRKLSMEELRRRNIQKSPVEIQHPTAEEWAELAAALTAGRAGTSAGGNIRKTSPLGDPGTDGGKEDDHEDTQTWQQTM